MEKLTTQNCIIARENRLCYCSPAHFTLIELCNIFGSLKVRVGPMPTNFTFNESAMSDSFSIVTDRAGFTCVSRIDINNSNSSLKSLVLNKVLELPESPLVNPFIVFSTLSDSLQIFHDDYVAIIQISNNRLANVVITPSHKLSPDPRDFFQFSLGGFRAFALKNRNKFVMLDSEFFNSLSEEATIRSYSDLINTKVNPKNFTMLVRSFGVFLGECKSEIVFIFFLGQETFSNLPIIKIFQSIFGNLNRNFNSSFNSGNRENIVSETETSWFVIQDRDLPNNRIGFFLLNNSTSHTNTSNRKLSSEPHFFEFWIDKRMQLNIVSNFHTPSSVNTELKPLLIQLNSFQNRIINFQFYGNTPNQHCKDLRNSNYLNISEDVSPYNPEGRGIRNIEFT